MSRSKPKERHLACPQCKSDETRRTRNYGRPLGDEQWCTKCGHRWEPNSDTALREKMRALDLAVDRWRHGTLPHVVTGNALADAARDLLDELEKTR